MNADKLAHKIAYQILIGFDKHYRWFGRITAQAQQRFERGRWRDVQQAQKDRINTYDRSLTEVVSATYELFVPQQQPRDFWLALKQDFEGLIAEHPQFELAETFFNSVIGRIFRHQRIDDDIMFVSTKRCHLTGQKRHRVVNTFEATGSITQCLQVIFRQYRFNAPFENYQRDMARLEQALLHQVGVEVLRKLDCIDILQPVFYRGKAAYLVGRMQFPDGMQPFVIALMLTDENEIYVDTLLTERRDLSVMFGFARAYFMVDSQYPAEIVAFLQELMPNKKHFELYIALGLYKHGKTEFYRGFLRHLRESEDKFEVAPGIKGLVMTVFHLPSYGVVFKVIKDEFGESKRFGRQHVVDRYRLVKMHDRVGRMADTHEFANFRLPRARLSDALLEELQQVAASSLEIKDDEVIIKHLYIERKMTPLNLYLQDDLSEAQKREALQELGDCIKQIAIANIFPGDMLHKNFGITRHGRIIFYDYDEICYMNERNFRELPKSDDPYALDTLSVAPEDVFPEQFEHFIVGRRDLKAIFKTLHPELFTTGFWKNVQRRCAEEVCYFTPYPEHKRFSGKGPMPGGSA